MTTTRRRRRAAAMAIAVGLGASAALSAQASAADRPHFADAEDRALVMLGKTLYRSQCAGCHGRYLQGQALWQLDDGAAGRRAPAFDASGFTWQRTDEEIFRIVKDGRLADTPPGAMPAFADRLDDRQILAIIAFIKARWPIALRILQAMRNPQLRGIPAAAAAGDWQLPPNCNAVLQRIPAAPGTPK